MDVCSHCHYPYSRGSRKLPILSRLKTWAKALKINILALYLAARDERLPTLPKWLALFTVAYALSPIDLIPDFIPVIGYLDDLIFLPLLIALCVRLIPGDIWQESMNQAKLRDQTKLAGNKWAAGIIVAIWILVIAVIVFWLIG